MNSFLSKVDAERMVLTVVNEVTDGPRQLAGLSSGAIATWQFRNLIPDNHSVVTALLNLADVCQSLSDRSNENFIALSDDKIDVIVTGIESLRAALHSISEPRILQH